MGIKSVAEYLEEIKRLKTEDKTIDLFRGERCNEWVLEPKITREGLLIRENQLIEGVLLEKPDFFMNDRYPIQTLIKLQHFGLPTRLLDFTANSLVALYFSCLQNKEKCDGRVFMIELNNYEIKNSFGELVNSVADMSFFTKDEFVKFTPSRAGTITDNYFKFISKKTYWIPPRSGGLESKCSKMLGIMENVIFFKPEFNNQRLINQQGYFAIFPNKISGNDNYSDLNIAYKKGELDSEFGIAGCATLTDKLINTEIKDMKEIVIDKDGKNDILNELKLLGITRSFLFPELENICKDVVKRNQY